MEIIYLDGDIIVCVKPPRVLSTDEPGGVPELLRGELGDERADVRTVHRLDRVVGGVMALARNAESASELSRQIRDGEFGKEYAAVVHGDPGQSGELRDLLWRDRARRMTFVAAEPGKDVREARLEYERLWSRDGLAGLRIKLYTGRTHQIRCQFASRGFPLAGERKYCESPDDCELALWSRAVSFRHPKSGEPLAFAAASPVSWPWSLGGNM